MPLRGPAWRTQRKQGLHDISKSVTRHRLQSSLLLRSKDQGKPQSFFPSWRGAIGSEAGGGVTWPITQKTSSRKFLEESGQGKGCGLWWRFQ